MNGSPCTDKHFFSECGMVGAAWVQYGAFPRELPPENISARVIPSQCAHWCGNPPVEWNCLNPSGIATPVTSVTGSQ